MQEKHRQHSSERDARVGGALLQNHNDADFSGKFMCLGIRAAMRIGRRQQHHKLVQQCRVEDARKLALV